MTAPMTVIALSPLVDRAGTVLHDATGVPLAADGDGLVYTMTADAGPTPLGELAEDDAGRVVLVPLGAIDPEDKGHKLTRLGRRRAHLRGRIAHHEGRLRRLTGAGAQPGDRRIEKHAGRIESLRAQLAQVQAELEAANAEALDGLADDTDDMQGLGSFKDFWVKNRKLIGGIGIGAAGTALVGSAMNPNSGLGKGVRAVPGLLKNFFVGTAGRRPRPTLRLRRPRRRSWRRFLLRCRPCRWNPRRSCSTPAWAASPPGPSSPGRRRWACCC
jgi:hypothetical protein